MSAQGTAHGYAFSCLRCHSRDQEGGRQPIAGSTTSRMFAWARLGQSSAMSLNADALSACCGLRAVDRRPTHDPWPLLTVPLTVPLTVRTTFPVLCPVSTYRVASTTCSNG